MKYCTRTLVSGIFLASVILFGTLVSADAQVTRRGQRPLITERIDSSKRSRLAGNTRPEANAANDVGAAPEDLVMEHMLLQLKRSADQEQALQRNIDDLHNSASTNFHKWMTPAEF